MSNQRLLLAEEDQHTRTLLAENLIADGYLVDVVEDRDQAVAWLRTTAPDVIVVDVNGTTLALLDWLRGADSALCAAATDTPVIVLTSRSEEVHWVRLLERGGDDVVVKPFSYPELRARIAAVLRRTRPRQPRPVLSAGPVQIDLRDRRVTVDGRTVELCAVEYRLLCHLAAEPSRVLTKVNFEQGRRKARGARDSGARGGIGDPLPLGEALAADYRASRLPWVRKRRFRT
jgi:two-component system phosphate regulon response regulator PhoB